jgi:hypothetical protein
MQIWETSWSSYCMPLGLQQVKTTGCAKECTNKGSWGSHVGVRELNHKPKVIWFLKKNSMEQLEISFIFQIFFSEHVECGHRLQMAS